MKNDELKKICVVEPHVMENCMLLSFSLEWMRVFNCIPTFEMFMDKNGRIVLISKEKVSTK